MHVKSVHAKAYQITGLGRDRGIVRRVIFVVPVLSTHQDIDIGFVAVAYSIASFPQACGGFGKILIGSIPLH